MIIIESPVFHTEQPSEADSVPEQLTKPPVDTWIDQFLKEDGGEAAMAVIGRVCELHLSEGFRLVKKYYSNFSNHPAHFFTMLCQYSRIITPNRVSFFKKVSDRVDSVQEPFTSWETNSIYDDFTDEINHVLNELKNTNSQQISVTEFASQWYLSSQHSELLQKHFYQLDKYYGSLLLPTLDFPELPPLPEDELHRQLLRGADNIISSDTNQLSWQSELQNTFAIQDAHRRYEQFWNPEDKAQAEAELPSTQELLFSYNIYELLPAEAKEVTAIATCNRGMIFRYELQGQGFVWFDGKSYQLDDVNQYPLATKEHWVIQGERGGQLVTIVDGKEYPGCYVLQQMKLEEHLVVVVVERLTNDVKTLIDGIPFDFFRFEQIKLISKDLLALTSNENKGITGYLINLSNYQVEARVESYHRECEITTISSQPYFVFHGSGPAYVVEPYSKQEFRPPASRKLAKDLNDPTTWYDLYDVGNNSYVAYNYSNSQAQVKTLQKDLGAQTFLDAEKGLDVGRLNYEVQRLGFAREVFVQNSLYDYRNPDVQYGVSSTDHVTAIPNKGEISPYQTMVNRSPFIVYLAKNGKKPTGFDLLFLPKNKEKSPPPIVSMNQELTAVYIGAQGEAHLVQSLPYPASPAHEGYIVGDQLIQQVFKGHTLMIGEKDSKPIVVIGPDLTNTRDYLLFHGAQKIDFYTDGVQLIWGFEKKSSSRGPALNSLGTFNPDTGLVKEINPYHAKPLTAKREVLAPAEVPYFALAKILEEYMQLYHQLQGDQPDYFDGPKTVSDSDIIRLKMSALKDIAKDSWRSLMGEPKNYFTNELQKKAAKEHYTEHPEKLLKLMASSGVDPLTREFEDQFVQTLLPELWQHEQKKLAHYRQQQRENSDQGENSKANKKMYDSVLQNSPSELQGGNAYEQFVVGDPLGWVDNFAPTGITEALKLQTEGGWQTFPLPPLTHSSKKLAQSTHYTKLVRDLSEVRLLLQPDSQLKADSVKIILADGTTTTPHDIRTVKGYPVIDLPPGATEVRYADEKPVIHLDSFDWKSYAKFRELFEQEQPDTYRGLTQPLSLDPRLLAQLEPLKKLSPLQALSAAEQLCRQAGIYDMHNQETERDRNGKTAAQTLDYARVRSSNLVLNPVLGRKQPEETHYYAGVCAESALVLVAMLRRLGFMAGITTEYRPKPSGDYSANDAHARVFALWPTSTYFADEYQLVYLDGTFTKSTNTLFDPPVTQSLAERVSAGMIEVEEELDQETKESGELTNGYETQDNKRHEQWFAPQAGEKQFIPTAWERTKRVELTQLSLLELSRLYQTLTHLMYTPPTAKSRALTEAPTNDQRWQLLYEEYLQLKPEKKSWKKLWGKVRLQMQTDKETAINSILIEFRKINEGK